MSEWVGFQGRIEPLTLGRATYTILRLPPEAAAAFGSARRVEGEISEHPVNLAVNRLADVDGPFLWAGQSLLDRIDTVPGEPLDIRLRPAPDDRVDPDPDIEAALRAGGVLSAWQGLTPGRRRGLLYQIATAKTEATRQKRIARLVEGLT